MEVHAWVLKTRKGDLDAFDELVMSFDQELRAFCACRCASAEMVEDVVQETWVLAHGRLASYDPAKGAFIGWLKGVARHLILQERERQTRDCRDSRTYAQTLVWNRAGERTEDLTDPLPALRACLERLQPRQRELLDLRYTKELACEEIGRRMEQSVTWVTTNLMRARELLRQCLRKTVGEEAKP